jgi:hypothetical protein
MLMLGEKGCQGAFRKEVLPWINDKRPKWVVSAMKGEEKMIRKRFKKFLP